MKKSTIAIGVVAILAVGYTAASWYTGNMIANNIDNKLLQLTDKINQSQNMATVAVQYSDYQQGIFSTQFHLTVSTVQNSSDEDLLDMDSEQEIIFDDNVTVYHGPLPWNLVKSADFSPQMAAVTYQTSKESNEMLWQAAGNQPFLTIDSTVDYSHNIAINIANSPLNYIYTSQKLVEESMSVSAGKALITTDHTLSQFKMTLELDNLDYHVKNLSEIFLSKLNYQGELSSNTEYKIKHQLSFDQMRLSMGESALNLNQVIVTQDDSINKNLRLNGQSMLTIGSAITEQQNLGKGSFHISYSGLPVDFAPQDHTIIISDDTQIDTAETDNIIDDVEIDVIQEAMVQRDQIEVNIDQFKWQTNVGDLDAQFMVKIEGDDLTSQSTYGLMDEDNISDFKVKINLPLKPLAYLMAQLQDPKSELITEQDIEQATFGIAMMSQLFLGNSPLFRIEMDEEESSQNGIFTDIDYSKQENRAVINGKTFPKGKFFDLLNSQ